MEDRSYRLAQYEIILEGSGEIWWKAHRGFAAAKSGKCFIEGDVLFIGPSERDEEGFLINEFLEYLDKFPPWDRTKYYCPSFRLYSCMDNRLWDGIEQSKSKETHSHNRVENSKMTSPDKRARISISSRIQMSQVKGKLGDAVRRCKALVGFRSKKDGSES